MDANELVVLLQQAGAIQYGPRILRSGKQTNFFIDAEVVANNSGVFVRLCDAFADKIAGEKFDLIVGVANGGVPYAQAVAKKCNVPWMEAVKMPDKTFHIPRCSILVKGVSVLVIDDVGMTGSGVRDVISALRVAGANISHVGYIIKRGDITSADVCGAPLVTLNDDPLENLLTK